MAKMTAWLITLIGILYTLPLINVDIGMKLSAWLVALSFLIIGISKLMIKLSGKKR